MKTFLLLHAPHLFPSTRFLLPHTTRLNMLTGLSAAVLTTLALLPLSGDAQAAPLNANTANPNAASTDHSSNKVTLNFVNAELEAVIKAVGLFVKRDFIVDPRVKGVMNLVSPRPVTPAEAYNTLLTTLRLQGFAVIETGGVLRVVPEADAKLMGGPISVMGDPSRNEGVTAASSAPRGEQIVTQVFRLTYESANNMVVVLRPLIAPNNTITAYPSNNTLVITDYAENLRRIAKIIAALDASTGNDLDVVPIVYSNAIDIAVLVNKLLDDAAKGAQADPMQKVMVLAEPRNNTLLLRAASMARLNLAKQLIAKLDTPTERPGNMYVVTLKNADAAKLANTLRAVLTGANDANNASSGSGGLSPSAGLSNPVMQNNGASNVNNGASTTGIAPAGGMNAMNNSNVGTSSFSSNASNTPIQAGGSVIQADASTNSLIITAPEPIYRSLRSIIEQLDVRRAQVYVESLIVEVTADTAAEFGIQWQDFSGLASNNTRVIGGTNFNNGTSGGSNIISAARSPLGAGEGLNLGIVRGMVNIPGIGQVTNLGLLARALETKGNGNILSTPNILTLDNEEAKIVIGQNVPFVTGQYATQAGGQVGATPFQTIERRDVGLTLRVKPQVSEGGTVKMQIFQEVSSVQSTSASGIITNRRAIESNVLVEDGQIIVLGGLVQDTVTDSQDKVPGLGDLPVFGGLFRYDARRKSKTNLMVFLRPYVLKTAEASQSVVADKYDYIRQEQMAGQFTPNAMLKSVKGDLLPTLQEQQQKAKALFDAMGVAGNASTAASPSSSPPPVVTPSKVKPTLNTTPVVSEVGLPSYQPASSTTNADTVLPPIVPYDKGSLTDAQSTAIKKKARK
jgi:general secretion pathway protein D